MSDYGPGVVWRGHPSWRGSYLLAHTFRATFAVLGGGFVLWLLANPIGVLSRTTGILLTTLLVLCAYGIVVLIHNTTTYIVTRTGIRKEFGIINRSRKEISIRKIQSVDVAQNLIERFILRTGTVELGSAATDENIDMIVFASINNPDHVADLIRHLDDPTPQPGSASGFGGWEQTSGDGQGGHSYPQAPAGYSQGYPPQQAPGGWDNGGYTHPQPPQPMPPQNWPGGLPPR